MMTGPLRRDDDEKEPVEPKPGDGGDEPKKQYGKNRVVVRDKETNQDFDFFENESKGFDGRKPGDPGEVIAVGGGTDEISIWVKEADEEGIVGLDQIKCERTYYVTREKFGATGNDKTCGGPNALQAEYKAVKDEVIRAAIRVADRCRRKPSCLAAIDFQSSFLACVQSKNPEAPGFYLQARYQVRVSCVTI
jgi:hypothetical protein